MDANIQIFNNPRFGQIRTAMNESNEPLFCLADVCKVLELDPSAVTRRLSDGVVSNHPIIDTLGRTQQANFVNEDGLYDTILDSRKPEARSFRKWITSEVLPSIRKTGGYMVAAPEETPEQIMARALIVAQDTIKRTEAEKRMLIDQNDFLNEQAKLSAPKIKYVNEVLQSTNTYTSTQIAKESGFRSADQIHQALKSKGIMFKQSGQWMLTAKYTCKGYTKPRTSTFTHSDGTQGTNTITVWTEKGRKFLHEILIFALCF